MLIKQFNHVTILRWVARIVSVPLFLIMIILFVEDRLPFFLFKLDPVHMFALSVMLAGLLIGWRWEGLAGGLILFGFLVDWLIVSVRMGKLTLNMGPIVSFFPIIGLIYLYGWWSDKKALLK